MLTGDLFGSHAKHLTHFEADLVDYLVDWVSQLTAMPEESPIYQGAYQFRVHFDDAGSPVVSHRHISAGGVVGGWVPFSSEHPLKVLGRVAASLPLRAQNTEYPEVR